jgi:enamine deaminase RidA (YjgF/YER057c/UK114 family)
MSGRVTLVQPPELGAAKGFSHGALAPAGARILFVAGQIGWDGAQRIVPGGFVAQFEQALANVMATVRAAGGAAGDICRLTVYVTDLEPYRADLEAVGVAYRRVLGRHFPAMALVAVAGLLEPGALVEIEATAAIPADPRGARDGADR